MTSSNSGSGGSSECVRCPEFLPIWKKGYGPKGGDKAEPVVWLKFIDDMDEDEYSDMITDVTCVDRNAPCALCPEFLPFWKKGYGPEGGDKATRKVWQDYLNGRSDYAKIIGDVLYSEDISPSAEEPEVSETDIDPELWDNYIKQFNESDGFDVVDSPGDSVLGAVGPAFSDMSLAMIDKEMIGFSFAALNVYNNREGTHFTLNRVLKANVQSIAGELYYITFEAIDPYDCLHIFQAMVTDAGDIPKEVVLVRLKSKLQMEANASV